MTAPQPFPAVFIEDGGRFRPTPLAASPWGDGVLHGGPPAALLARAVERAAPDPGLFVSRLTIDLFRPVPAEPLETRATIVRQGRRIAVIDASLLAGGVEVSRASALLLRRMSDEALAGEDLPFPVDPHDHLPAGRLMDVRNPVRSEASSRAVRPGFHTTIEVKSDPREQVPGAVVAWIRVPVPVVAGEETTPLVRVAATSDFGNALAQVRTSSDTGFINADITLYLHRLPVGEWVKMATRGVVEPYGLGVSDSTLSDEHGELGRVVQARLLNRYRQ